MPASPKRKRRGEKRCKRQADRAVAEFRRVVRRLQDGELKANAPALLLSFRENGLSLAVTVVPSPIHELTDRERQVLAHLGRSKGNKGIAEELGVSRHTVKHYVSKILSKLNCKTRAEAARLAEHLPHIWPD